MGFGTNYGGRTSGTSAMGPWKLFTRTFHKRCYLEPPSLLLVALCVLWYIQGIPELKLGRHHTVQSNAQELHGLISERTTPIATTDKPAPTFHFTDETLHKSSTWSPGDRRSHAVV